MAVPLKKFSIYCQTDQRYETSWAETTPTECPVNSSHSIGLVFHTEQIDTYKIDDTLSAFPARHRHIQADTTNGNVTITLLPALFVKNRRMLFKKIASANMLTINPDGTELIDGNLTKQLSGLNDTLIIESDGVEWTSLPVNSEVEMWQAERPQSLNVQPYTLNTTLNEYTPVARFIFPGSIGCHLKANAYMTGLSTSYSIRVMDVANNKIIAESTFANTGVDDIVNLGSGMNVPLKETVLTVMTKVLLGVVYLNNLEITYI